MVTGLLRAIFFIILKCKVHWLFFVPRWPGFWLKKYAPCWIHIRQRWISRLSLNSETPPTGTRSLSKDFILVWSYGEFCLIPQETINFSFYVCPSCLLGRISINCTSFCSMFTYNLIQFILKLDDSVQREFSDKAWLVRCVLDPFLFLPSKHLVICDASHLVSVTDVNFLHTVDGVFLVHKIIFWNNQSKFGFRAF